MAFGKKKTPGKASEESKDIQIALDYKKVFNLLCEDCKQKLLDYASELGAQSLEKSEEELRVARKQLVEEKLLEAWKE